MQAMIDLIDCFLIEAKALEEHGYLVAAMNQLDNVDTVLIKMKERLMRKFK